MPTANIIGFTGTRKGMTPDQAVAVDGLLRALQPSAAHHGDCIGADASFHRLCLSYDIPVVLHPPVESRHRAYCAAAHQALPVLSYMDRNLEIVKAVNLMIACPLQDFEVLRSGTWATIRMAVANHTTIAIVNPSGSRTWLYKPIHHEVVR